VVQCSLSMDSRYDHKQQEEVLYKEWEKSGAFEPKNDSDKTFTIMMPPPNANDPLHIGHAMFIAIEDILIRYHRMLGDATLWLPGTDHAGIETQFVFEKKLKKKKQSRFQFDRETLYKMIWNYVQENSTVAVDQMKKIGASADWSRFTFMLDEKVVEQVLGTFLKLHQDELLYRDEQLVNYCTHCGTSFSELEVVYQDQNSPLYYVKYPLVKNPTEFLTVATVRPEPIFADTHLAVHPEDEDHNHLIGEKVLNPITNEEMEIIGDEFVDPEFGTGIVKLTPAHDANDFAVAKNNNLPIYQAINLQGKITKNGGKYAGMKVKSAREAVVKDLKEKNLIEKIDEKYQNRVGTCYRCKRPIEPLLLPQFFIRVKQLTQPILEDLKNKKFTVHGAGHDKILKHWLENLKDWNISRQIVWGIRIPVWYKAEENPEIVVSFIDQDGEKKTEKLGKLLEQNISIKTINKGIQELRAPINSNFVVSIESPGENYLQETDTFDTWFSSAQWPFTTLKKNQDDFDRFYPTQVMETGYDILPFWVMRMLMMGKYVTGKLPFTNVYLHGLVRDQKGQKMSKSKGNVVNPLDIAEKYGSDALRMALVIRSSAGLDKSVSEQDFKAMRNFSNKIWNASRFILEYLDLSQLGETKINKKFEEKLITVTDAITKNLDKFQIGLAAETVYSEFWHWFCDEQIEIAKGGSLGGKELVKGLKQFLILLHPFVPFVTEAVWQELKNKELVEDSLLITTSWPTKNLAE
jgi:valyl-tRNA synthetase